MIPKDADGKSQGIHKKFTNISDNEGAHFLVVNSNEDLTYESVNIDVIFACYTPHNVRYLAKMSL